MDIIKDGEVVANLEVMMAAGAGDGRIPKMSWDQHHSRCLTDQYHIGLWLYRWLELKIPREFCMSMSTHGMQWYAQHEGEKSQTRRERLERV